MKARPDADFENIYLFKEPIRFKITVNDELLDAEVVCMKEEYLYETEEDKDDVGYCPGSCDWFTIKFSNGHSDDYCIEDKEVFINGGNNDFDQDEYTEALQPDICWAMEMWTYFRPVYTLRWPIDGKETNIWIYSSGNETFIEYAVVFNSDYRFNVKRENDQWTSYTVRKVNPEPINEALAAKVISLLKYYLIQPPEVIHLPNPERLKPKERQPRIITDLPKTYQFAVPITFIIHVQGELLYARIESVRFEYHGYEDDCFTWYEINWFTIKFSDGHEDEYCVDDYETTTSKGQDKYANALHGEICMALADWTEDCTVYTLGWPIDGIETNIWVYRVDVNAVPEYFVDYNGDYRFSVRFENGQWTALTVRIKDPEIIDPKLAKKVIAMLKHYHRQGLGLDGTRHGNEE